MEKCIFFCSQLMFVSTVKMHQVLSLYEVPLKQEKKKVAKNNENKKTAKKRDILAPIGIKRKNFID